VNFRSKLLKGKARKRKRLSALGRRRKRMFKIKVALAIFIFVAVTVLIAWLLRLPEVTINKSFVAGNSITATEDIKLIANEHMEGAYLGLVPKASAFFYPKAAIARSINNSFTRIKEVVVNKSDFTTITINVVERTPFALWCGEAYSLDGENLGNCYFIDELSYLYAKAPDFTESVFFKYFGEIEKISLHKEKAPLGASYMGAEDFFGIRPFIEAFEELGYVPVSLTRVDNKDFELRMDDGAIILFGSEAKLSVLLDNMESILDSDSFRESEGVKVEYIDLRFGNKIYYKFIDEEAEAIFEKNVE